MLFRTQNSQHHANNLGILQRVLDDHWRPKEGAKGEQRVAATPQSTKRLIKLGYDVVIESGAGELASFPDALYTEAGATVAEDAAKIWSDSDIVIMIDPPQKKELAKAKDDCRLISFVWPAKNDAIFKELQNKSLTALAMDCVPRNFSGAKNGRPQLNGQHRWLSSGRRSR